MSHTKKTLQPGESITYEASVHWLVFLPSIICTLLIVMVYGIYSDIQIASGIIKFLLFFLVPSLIYNLIAKFSTELSITNKRIVVSSGFFRKSTYELMHSSINIIRVDQYLLERIFNGGSIIIFADGGVIALAFNIYDPHAFRKIAMETIEDSQLWPSIGLTTYRQEIK